MAQVVTNENMGEFIKNREVPAFVPPVETPPVAAAATPPPADGVDKTPPADVKRDASGKFVAQAADEPAKPATPPATGDDADDDENLPERVKRQIGKKHRLMKEAEEFARERDAEAAKERQRADNAESELRKLRGEPKSKPDEAKGAKAPEAKDFKTVAEYADALVDWKLAERQRLKDEADATKQASDAAATAQTAFQGRIAQAIKDIPDYAEVVAAADYIVPPAMAQFIVDSELGPQIGFHFAKHPDELERLSKLSPIRQIAEMGKLETKLEKPATPPAAKVDTPPAAKPVSKAPAPIAPLGSDGTAVVQKDPSEMSFQELRAFRQSERAAGKR